MMGLSVKGLPPWIFWSVILVVASIPYQSSAQQGYVATGGEGGARGGGGGGREGQGAEAAVRRLLGVVGSVRDAMDILSTDSSSPSSSSQVNPPLMPSDPDVTRTPKAEARTMLERAGTAEAGDDGFHSAEVVTAAGAGRGVRAGLLA